MKVELYHSRIDWVVRRQEVIGFSRTGIDVIHHNKEAGTF